jgi:hypothetical protein
MPFRKKKTNDEDSTKKPKTSLLQKLRRRDGKKKDKTVTEARGPPLSIPQQNQKSISTPNSGVKPQPQTASKTTPSQGVSINALPIRGPPSQLGDNVVQQCYCRHGKKSIFSFLRSDFPPPPNAKCCIHCGRCQKCAFSRLSDTFLRCSLCRSKSPLLSLPRELQDEIFSHLPIPSTWLLRLTSRFFYHSIPAPIGPLDYAGTLALYASLRSSIPSDLVFCEQCMRYHPWTPSDYYVYKGSEHCLRDWFRTRRPPQLPSNVVLDVTHYICLHCMTVRGNRSCISCAKCEFCAGVKFQGHSVECIECDAGKARCPECKALRLQHRGCKGCGKCEQCARTLFQFGVSYCVGCGGGWNMLDKGTKKVLVESGPGYEMFHYRDGSGGGGGGRGGRIGIR